MERINRLLHERSPYLQQHAQNPVDWFPWGPEAFEKARAENKPVFLSIGYSTCHWCHVMAHESFENETIAALLNEAFVNVKVDREERPDIDQIYMAYVQAETGAGGWPMSVWLTPEAEPFYGSTYFPPEDRYGRPGFLTVLKRIRELWETQSENLRARGKAFLDTTRQALGGRSGVQTHSEVVEIAKKTQASFIRSFDIEWGGFGKAPKFPRSATLEFLMTKAWIHRDDPEAAQTACFPAVYTLRCMSCGGIRDHVGGGFHRYSVDRRWHVPHFEKMLCDQALITRALVDAFKITGDAFFQSVATETIRYVLRELRNSRSGFFSAEDADSEAGEAHEEKEGAFYVWRAAEIEAALEPDTASIIRERYAISVDGNVDADSDPHGEFSGVNVLRLAEGSQAEDTRILEGLKTLFQIRNTRPRPGRDEKIITAWNGLMIRALATAGPAFGESAWTKAAVEAAEFLQKELIHPVTKILHRSYCRKRGPVPGFAEDYAFLIAGLLELFSATSEVRWLKWAQELQQQMNQRFLDVEHGGYFTSDAEDPTVVLRLKTDHDGAEPAASSIAIGNLRRLAFWTGDETHLANAHSMIRCFQAELHRSGTILPHLLAEALLLEGLHAQLIVTGAHEDSVAVEMIALAHKAFAPGLLILRISPENHTALTEAVRGLPIADLSPKKTAAYLCADHVCRAPVHTLTELAQILHPLVLRSGLA